MKFQHHAVFKPAFALSSLMLLVAIEIGFPEPARVQPRDFTNSQLERFVHTTLATTKTAFAAQCSRMHGRLTVQSGHGGMTRQHCDLGQREFIDVDFCSETPWLIRRAEQDFAPASAAFNSAASDGDRIFGARARAATHDAASAQWQSGALTCGLIVQNEPSAAARMARRWCKSGDGEAYAISHCNMGDP